MHSSRNATAPSGWQVGDVIEGRYEILARIGMGGMGAVWKVHHREWNRLLAVKTALPVVLASRALRERYIREAETWVGLGVHPHIVQCWYVLSIAGEPCLFLDFMTEGSLKERIADGRVGRGNWLTVISLALQVAAGLAHSHDRGVIHRDIKPENLLFKDPSTIAVTDFGLVKTALPDTIERSTGLAHRVELGVSGSGAFLGTPQYGAPEQWGAAERVGPAADIYAFGITLYEMCCGRRPFDIEGDPSVTLEGLINAHLRTPPPDPRTFHPEIPEELVLLCLACLEKTPARRPPSMEAIRGVLGALYQRLSGQAHPAVASLPTLPNPDILNNSAVSMLSLGRRDDARAAWRRALRVESAHSESLYNLVQLERREGRIGFQEALRRLQQAKANYPLALLCIEQGLAKEAVTILSEVATEDRRKQGLVQRALGDALMYSQQFYAAEKAYQVAFNLMPNDQDTALRKKAAAQGRRDLQGVVLFPLPCPRFTLASGAPLQCVSAGSLGEPTLAVTEREFLILDMETERFLEPLPRLPDARPVERIWRYEKRLLLQEQGAFQLRLLPDLKLIGRKGGRVLAVAPDLSRLVLLTREGPVLYTFEKNTFEAITGAEPEAGSPGPLAAFDPSGSLLCLVLVTGELAQLDADLRAVPAEWPNPLEQPARPSALALSAQGLAFVGYACGTVRAFDVTAREVRFSAQLPGPILALEVTAGGQGLLATLPGVKILLDDAGRPLWQGPGPVQLEAGGQRLLGFSRSHLHLWECQPFHLHRRWETADEGVTGLSLALDGSVAVSWNRQGSLSVWEVFEDHRVYERSQLLSPGRSYQDLVQGAQTFPAALGEAQREYDAGNWLAAYRHLLRARGIVGYGQVPEALDRNWDLVRKMGRDQVDAVWERLSLPASELGPIDLSPSGDHLLLVLGNQVTVRQETPQHSRVLWQWTSPAPLLAARFEGHQVFCMEDNGRWTLLDLETGQPQGQGRLEGVTLRRVRLLEHTVLFLTALGQAGCYDRKTGVVTSLSPALEGSPQEIFPWYGGQAVVLTAAGAGVVDLNRKNGSGLQEFSSKAYQPPARVSWLQQDAARRILAVGCDDGTLALLDQSHGRLLYAISNISGAITGFQLLPELQAGLVTTALGQLYLWDLGADRVLEGLLAHRGGILELRADAEGRYLVTSGKDGQVRLWEVSWTASLSLEERAALSWLPSDSPLMSKLARFFRRGG